MLVKFPSRALDHWLMLIQSFALTPMELFDKMFTLQMFEHMKEQFELYARRDMNYPAFATSTDEVKEFVGILLISGYHHLPMKHDNWSTAEELGCKAVASAMSNKKPTNWWGRENAAPLKFDPKQYEAALWTVFSNFHKCRPA